MTKGRIKLLLASLLALGPPATAAGASYELSYGGRLTDAAGQPVAGPVHLSVAFYRAGSGGEPLVAPLALDGTPLAGGVFQIRLALAPADFSAVFADVTTPVYVEVTDVTHGKVYPRQLFSMVPYAGKVPVDGTTVDYDANGRLTVGPQAAPGANQFLTKDGTGALVWATPSANATQLAGAAVAAGSPSPGQLLRFVEGQWTPTNDAGVNRAGDSGLGTLVLAPQAALGLGTFAGTPSSLAAGDAGKTWFDTTAGMIEYWDGAAVKTLGVAAGGLQSLNGATGSTQTFAVPGTAGTSPGWVTNSAANTHTLEIPLAAATGVTAGLVSHADYVGFQGKVSKSGDTMTGSLGIGTTSAASALDVAGAVTQRGMAAPAVSTAGQGRVYFDQSAGQFLVSQNGGGYAPLATGTPVVSVTAGAGLTGGGSGASVTLGLPSVGTSGTYAKVFTDAQGRVTAGASLTAGDLPALTAAMISGTFAATQVGAVPAAQVTGTLAAAQLPSIPAAQVTGTFAAAQLPSIPAAQLSGTLTAAQLPSIPVTQLSGTFAAAQLPAIPATALSGTLATAQLPTIPVSQLGGTLAASQLPSLPMGQLTGTLAASQLAPIPATQITGTLAATQVPSIPTTLLTGTLAASQVAPIPATQVTGTFATTQIPALPATQLTGTLAASQVAAIPAAQITGTLAASQVAPIPAAQITGTLAASQVAPIPAAQITGTLVPAQIPALPSTQLTGTLAVGQIPALPAAQITNGTFSLALLPSYPAAQLTGTLAAAQVGGTLAVAQIPALPAGQIMGTFAVAQIPSLPPSLISGTLATTQLPPLAASQITSGTLGLAQIPLLPASQIAGGTLSVAQLPSLSAAEVTSGTLAVALGGTGATTFSSGGVLVGAGALPVSTVAAASQYQVLQQGGSGPVFGALSLGQASAVSGVLPVANGGTGSNAALAGNRVLVSSGTALTEGPALANGQLLIGSGAAAPVAATLTQGTTQGVTVTPGAGSLALDTAQDIRTGAVPTFAGLKLASPAVGSLVKVGAGGSLTAAGAADVTSALTYVPVNKAGDSLTGALTLPANGLTVGSTQLVVTGGNVGIGTTSPDPTAAGAAYRVVNVQGPNTSGGDSAGIVELSGQVADASGNLAGVLAFMETANTGGPEVAFIASRTAGATATNRGGILQFATKADNGVDVSRMLIDQSGNVAVGPGVPSARLHVQGVAGTDGIMFPDGTLQTTATGATYGSFFRTTALSYAASATWYDIPLASEQAKANVTHSTTTNPERVQVTAAGVYQVTYTATHYSTNGACTAGMRLSKNGTTEVPGTFTTAAPSVTSGSIPTTVTTIVTLAANDYLTLQGSSNNSVCTLSNYAVAGGGGLGAPTTEMTASLTIVRLQ